MREDYTFKGKLKNGECIYVDKVGDIFIEKDHKYLVCPTPLEAIEASIIVADKNEARNA